MLKTYSVQYWNDKGQRVGTIIQAQSALDAKMQAETMTGFKTLITYPKEI